MLTSIGLCTVLARGRGFARLIEAAMEGEPWAIGILAVIVVIFVVSIVMKMRSSDEYRRNATFSGRSAHSRMVTGLSLDY